MEKRTPELRDFIANNRSALPDSAPDPKELPPF
jgi:hypothetical protein